VWRENIFAKNTNDKPVPLLFSGASNRMFNDQIIGEIGLCRLALK